MVWLSEEQGRRWSIRAPLTALISSPHYTTSWMSYQDKLSKRQRLLRAPSPRLEGIRVCAWLPSCHYSLTIWTWKFRSYAVEAKAYSSKTPSSLIHSKLRNDNLDVCEQKIRRQGMNARETSLNLPYSSSSLSPLISCFTPKTPQNWLRAFLRSKQCFLVFDTVLPLSVFPIHYVQWAMLDPLGETPKSCAQSVQWEAPYGRTSTTPCLLYITAWEKCLRSISCRVRRLLCILHFFYYLLKHPWNLAPALHF